MVIYAYLSYYNMMTDMRHTFWSTILAIAILKYEGTKTETINLLGIQSLDIILTDFNICKLILYRYIK
jgi:hypothetical protein